MKKPIQKKLRVNTTEIVAAPTADASDRRVRGRKRAGASFPVAPLVSEMPVDYAAVLGEIKRRIQEERLRVVMAANSAMVMLYWDIGRLILDRQEKEGWGAKIIDRLSADLCETYPDMKGLSPRNLKYMRAFAAAWTDRSIVQQLAAQIPWRSPIDSLSSTCHNRSSGRLLQILDHSRFPDMDDANREATTSQFNFCFSLSIFHPPHSSWSGGPGFGNSVS